MSDWSQVKGKPTYDQLADDYRKACENLHEQRVEIESLRAKLEAYELASQEGHPSPCTLGPLCPYCEIESLRTKLEAAQESLADEREQRNDARDACDRSDSRVDYLETQANQLRTALTKAEAENARLRKALEEFEDCDMHDGNCDSLETASARIRDIARKALEGTT